tara:strand:+ start:533 stop:790 length:258 start_codon:yes stop_codon:yes gene_type:complete
METLVSSSFILSLLSALAITMLFIYYQKTKNKNYKKTPVFYASIFFIVSSFFYNFYTKVFESSDIGFKRILDCTTTEMKTGLPPF